MNLSEYEKIVFDEFSKKMNDYTKKDYLSKVLLLKSILKEGKDLFSANKEDMTIFIEHIKSKYAKSTCEKIYSYVHSFYNYLNKEGYIDINPMKFVEKPVVSRIKNKDDVLSFDEVNKIINSLPKLNPRDRAIIVFLISTGCLLSEVVNLKWKDLMLDMDNNCFCSVGLKKRQRVIKLHPRAFRFIMEYRESLNMPKEVFPTEEFIFKGRSTDSITDRNVRIIVKKALDIAGLKNYSAKDFRHSFAAFSLRLGTLDEDIKNYLGWSDKYYAIRYKYVINFIDSKVGDYILPKDDKL